MSNPSDRDARESGPSDDAQDLRRLFELSLDLMCVAGFDGFFKRVNPAFEQLLGHSQEALLGSSFLEFVHVDDRERTLAEVEHLSRGSLTVDFENRYRTASGDYRWLAWRSTPVVEQGLIYAVARDITEQKRVQRLLTRQAQELRRSNADLARFAYVASHDLRAPLRSIVNLTRFVEEDLGEGLPEKTRAHLDELRRRALRMKALTDDLLVYSQAGGEGEIAEVDTGKLVDDIAFLLDPAEGFTVETTGEMPVFETARGPLEQVLRNLIGNALEHHDRSEGRVTVSSRELGEFWELTVRDDGPGIPEDDQDRVFHAFERLGEIGEGGGTGMGLAIVQRIVTSFGGRIHLEPGGGRGATFRFSWPKAIAVKRSRRRGRTDGERDDAQNTDR